MDRFFAFLSDGVHRFEGRMDYTALGHTANLAARMEQIADTCKDRSRLFQVLDQLRGRRIAHAGSAAACTHARATHAGTAHAAHLNLRLGLHHPHALDQPVGGRRVHRHPGHRRGMRVPVLPSHLGHLHDHLVVGGDLQRLEVPAGTVTDSVPSNLWLDVMSEVIGFAIRGLVVSIVAVVSQVYPAFSFDAGGRNAPERFTTFISVPSRPSPSLVKSSEIASPLHSTSICDSLAGLLLSSVHAIVTVALSPSTFSIFQVDSWPLEDL